MALRFNPPPNWPAPPAGFQPGPGWQPDPAWGPAPEGWQLWVDDGAHDAASGGPAYAPPVPPPPASGGAPPPYAGHAPMPGQIGVAEPDPKPSKGRRIGAWVLLVLGILFTLTNLNRAASGGLSDEDPAFVLGYWLPAIICLLVAALLFRKPRR